jgi:hypothetical protein
MVPYEPCAASALGQDMHFLTSLIIFSGFVFVICLGLVQVVCDLSRMSGHTSPHMLSTEAQSDSLET